MARYGLHKIIFGKIWHADVKGFAAPGLEQHIF